MARVEVSVADHIATLQLTHPPLNAVDSAMRAELLAIADRLGGDDDVHAVIVHGSERAFAAGADIKEMIAMSPPEMAAGVEVLQDAFGALSLLPQPTLAAITGVALGGGLEVALACDFRICGASSRLGVPEVLLGLIPGGGGTQRLARLVGPAVAKDLVFTGRQVPAAEALALGLVSEVVPDDQVLGRARELMTRFVGAARVAIRAAKTSIDRGLDVDLAAGLAVEREQFVAAFGSQDAGSG